MLNYNTTLPTAGPGFAAPPKLPSPYAVYGQNHRDVLAGLQSPMDANYGIAQSKANADYDMRKLEAERQLALQGLQQMSQAQQNSNDLANQRFSLLTGTAGGLLRDLFS